MKIGENVMTPKRIITPVTETDSKSRMCCPTIMTMKYKSSIEYATIRRYVFIGLYRRFSMKK